MSTGVGRENPSVERFGDVEGGLGLGIVKSVSEVARFVEITKETGAGDLEPEGIPEEERGLAGGFDVLPGITIVAGVPGTSEGNIPEDAEEPEGGTKVGTEGNGRGDGVGSRLSERGDESD